MPTETKEEVQKFQWIKGDNQGKVETFTGEMSGKFMVFESGRRCNKSLLGEFLHEVNEENPELIFDDPISQPINSKAKTKSTKRKSNSTVKVKSQNPLIPLLEKTKKNKTKLNVRFEVELPTKKFLGIMSESFDEDVVQILSDYIISQIDDPRTFVSKHLKTSINEWYKYNNKTKTGETK